MEQGLKPESDGGFWILGLLLVQRVAPLAGVGLNEGANCRGEGDRDAAFGDKIGVMGEEGAGGDMAHDGHRCVEWENLHLRIDAIVRIVRSVGAIAVAVKQGGDWSRGGESDGGSAEGLCRYGSRRDGGEAHLLVIVVEACRAACIHEEVCSVRVVHGDLQIQGYRLDDSTSSAVPASISCSCSSCLRQRDELHCRDLHLRVPGPEQAEVEDEEQNDDAQQDHCAEYARSLLLLLLGFVPHE